MAEIEITLPTVAYANVKVRATPEELGVELSSPAAVGTATAIYLNLFIQGFELGASMDVTASPTEDLSAPVSASQGAPEPNPKWTPGVAPTDPEVLAKVALNEGLGGVTEIDSVIEETVAKAADIEAKVPWEQKVDAPKKPWETEATAPAVVSEDW